MYMYVYELVYTYYGHREEYRSGEMRGRTNCTAGKNEIILVSQPFGLSTFVRIVNDGNSPEQIKNGL